MKKEFRAHPLMMFRLMRPFLIFLIYPVVQGAIQYFVTGTFKGAIKLELIALLVISIIVGLRCAAFKLILGSKTVTIKTGVWLKKKAVIPISKLSSVRTEQNPVDAIFNAVTYRINTEAGSKRKSDFEFKLSKSDSREASKLLYGEKEHTAVKFSAFKVAVMAVTTSSAVTGIFVAVPIISNIGRLIGVGIEKMLLDEINNISQLVDTHMPPIVSRVSLILALFYLVSAIYLLFKYINFKLYLDDDKLEVRTGFFVRRRTAFKKKAVNDVKIEQSPLMRLFKRYSLKVSVGGYGDTGNETAVIVPSGRLWDIKKHFIKYFSFLEPDGDITHSKRDVITQSRFLFFPGVYLLLLIAVSITASLLFVDFTRLILFLTLIIGVIIVYYAGLSIYEYKFGKMRLGSNIFAHSVKGFNTREMYAPKENIGQIKIVRYLPDLIQGTCQVVISVHSESADSIKVRMLDYTTTKEKIFKTFDINE